METLEFGKENKFRVDFRAYQGISPSAGDRAVKCALENLVLPLSEVRISRKVTLLVSDEHMKTSPKFLKEI